MSDIICITNRRLCSDDFLEQIQRLAAAGADSIVLREKDLSEEEYIRLAEKVITVCRQYPVRLTLHFFYRAAIRLGTDRIHLPLYVLEQMSDSEKRHFSVIGVSCHSAEEAVRAQKLGAGYITAGHIFPTDCKAGLAGRGLDFLRDVKDHVSIPVYAIGGISAENAASVIENGADGICIMSALMKERDPAGLISTLRRVTEQHG